MFQINSVLLQNENYSKIAKVGSLFCLESEFLEPTIRKPYVKISTL